MSCAGASCPFTAIVKLEMCRVLVLCLSIIISECWTLNCRIKTGPGDESKWMGIYHTCLNMQAKSLQKFDKSLLSIMKPITPRNSIDSLRMPFIDRETARNEMLSHQLEKTTAENDYFYTLDDSDDRTEIEVEVKKKYKSEDTPKYKNNCIYKDGCGPDREDDYSEDETQTNDGYPFIAHHTNRQKRDRHQPSQYKPNVKRYIAEAKDNLKQDRGTMLNSSQRRPYNPNVKIIIEEVKDNLKRGSQTIMNSSESNLHNRNVKTNIEEVKDNIKRGRQTKMNSTESSPHNRNVKTKIEEVEDNIKRGSQTIMNSSESNLHNRNVKTKIEEVKDNIKRGSQIKMNSSESSPHDHNVKTKIEGVKDNLKRDVNSGQRNQYNLNVKRYLKNVKDNLLVNMHSRDHEDKRHSIDNACALHCFVETLKMTDETGFPNRHLVRQAMIKDIEDQELKDFLSESADECFQILKADKVNKCEYSKNLLICLSDKGRNNCDDWRHTMRKKVVGLPDAYSYTYIKRFRS